MKRSLTASVAAIALAAGLAGCVVAPVAPYEPVGVAYVGPAYAMPAPGYIWVHHARHGWGWRHPRHGWHRGWR